MTRVDPVGGTTFYCTEYISTEQNQVVFILEGVGGEMYLGTLDDYGIYFPNEDVVACDIAVGVPTRGQVRAMVMDAESPPNLWAGTVTSLWKCTPDHPDSMSCNDACTAFNDVFPGVIDSMSALVLDHGSSPAENTDDALWVGSSTDGLAHFDLSTTATTQVWNQTTGLPSEAVLALALDRQTRTLYVGTADAGVLRYAIGEDAWDQLSTAEGLPSSRVQSLTLDPIRRWLWIATDAGVARLYLPR